MPATPASFYVTGGTLRPDAPSYVERRADTGLYEALRNGEFCYVLTPRQMGKSSLMVRTALRLEDEGIQVAVLDLTGIGQNVSPEQWYEGLLERLGRQLGLEEELEQFWLSHARLGPLQRWMAALEQVVLAKGKGQGAKGSGPDPDPLPPAPCSVRAQRLVLFVDEIDTVRSLPFSTDEFFAAIRECYNRRSLNPEFERLTFCLLGVATPTDLIRDVRMTPFNIGRRIELTDFTESEAAPLAAGLAGPLAEGLLQRVLYWTGGHPYLTQRLCSAVAEAVERKNGSEEERKLRSGSSSLPLVHSSTHSLVNQLCEELFLTRQARERDDNLIFVRERLLNSEMLRAALLDLYGQVQSGKRVRDDEANPLVSVLRLAGVTRGVDGLLRVRNRIYERVFDRDWVRENMPFAELRRQRAAYYQGVLRATAIGGVALAALVGLVLVSTHQRPLNQSRRLPDGSLLTLKAVTYGKQHRYEPGRFRMGWLSDLLPPLQRFISPANAFTTDHDALVVWTEHRGQPPGQAVTQGTAMPPGPGVWHPRIVALDNSGRPVGEGTAQFLGSQGSVFVEGWVLNTFPRRATTVMVRLDQVGPTGHWVAGPTFTLNNPAPGPFPVFQAEALPATREVGDVSFTLTGFWTGVTQGSTPWSPPHPAGDEDPWTTADFRARISGRPAVGWNQTRFEISDASGNVPQPRGQGGGADPSTGKVYCNFAGLLIPDETWKLRVRFVHDNEAVYGGDATETVRGLPVPPPGEARPFPKALTLQGVRLGVAGIAWKRKLIAQSGSDVTYDPHLSPFVEVKASGELPDHVLTLRATDDRDREVGVTPPFVDLGSTNPEFWLELPRGARKVDLTFTIQTARYAEFYARPSLPGGK